MDFSAQARNALCWAQNLASALGARLVLLHVIDVYSLARSVVRREAVIRFICCASNRIKIWTN
jgi:hypothetical protein